METDPLVPAAARACLAVLDERAPADTLAWLRSGLPSAGAAFARGPFFGFYAGAGRRLRQVTLALSDREREALAACGLSHPEVWSAPDLARAALLVAACAVTPEDEHVPLATEAFRKGDNAERVALLRALPLLPAPERFMPLAVEACQSHVLDVFAAIACENPFPARFFPELHFDQLVLKALFLDLALERVVDWRARLNPELVRMARDYAAERRAAGRPVSSDLALLSDAKEMSSP